MLPALVAESRARMSNREFDVALGVGTPLYYPSATFRAKGWGFFANVREKNVALSIRTCGVEY